MAGAGLESRLSNVNGPGKAFVFDATTRKQLYELDQPAWATAAAFSPDGQILLTGGADGVVRQWDMSSGKQIRRPIAVGDSVLSLAINRDGKTFITGCSNGVTKVWDVATGAATGTSFAQKGWVRQLEISADGKLVLTSGSEKAARVWDAITGEAVGAPLDHQDSVIAATLSPDGKQIVTGSCDNTVKFWETPSLREISAERVECEIQVRTGVELGRDGVLRPLDAETWWQRRGRLQELDGAP
jgi:WD40 repeat protein